MEKATYAAQDVRDVRRLCAAINSTPQDKRTIMTVMAETFISGMKAQERLSATATAEAQKLTAR